MGNNLNGSFNKSNRKRFVSSKVKAEERTKKKYYSSYHEFIELEKEKSEESLVWYDKKGNIITKEN